MNTSDGLCLSYQDFERETGRPSEEEPPRPLVRDLQPPEPYPVDDLGDVLGPAARPSTTAPRHR